MLTCYRASAKEQVERTNLFSLFLSARFSFGVFLPLFAELSFFLLHVVVFFLFFVYFVYGGEGSRGAEEGFRFFI